MRVALAFWGITRSLKRTIHSIEQHIINVLQENNIEYQIFLHTYIVTKPYSNNRNQEYNVQLDNEEYKLLHPYMYLLDDQEEIKKKIDLTKYRSHPDPWATKYNSVDNFILAMYSKKCVTNLIENSRMTFDYIMYLRPDVLYKNKFDVNFFNFVTDKTICIPDFHCYMTHIRFNDRFAICHPNNYRIYGRLLDLLYDYSKTKPAHSEIFQHTMLTQKGFQFKHVPFHFWRVRANGSISQDRYSKEDLKWHINPIYPYS